MLLMLAHGMQVAVVISAAEISKETLMTTIENVCAGMQHWEGIVC